MSCGGEDTKTSLTATQSNKMATDKIKVAVRVRPFSRRGKWFLYNLQWCILDWYAVVYSIFYGYKCGV